MDTLNVHIDISEKYEETTVTIQAKEWTKELETLVRMVKSTKPIRLLGIDAEQSVLLDPNEIDYVYAENRKVYAAVQKQRIELKMKLYEAESLLEPHQFTRFSKSVIGNLNRIQRFELAFNGNLCVHFTSGNKEYVSRKYVAQLKEKLLSGGLTHGN
ncbi:LytTR family DNA-binding domain-containing protein [Novibacillus thermophilus]|jgi:DNA-binding LytR/AlgR family response regulator|uniref:LytTR family DNA-binding domain-containing protein n=1 Tax=Novibacillus thermophilus TaxID=1471761 RepID=UPI000989CCAD|nr:LytTR family DNA-binding domain-containing protein [Novibacillus thermophilus]